MPVELDQLAERSRFDLPDLPGPLLRRITLDVAREMCREGRLWRHVFEPVAVVYTLTPPADSVLHDIDGVTVNGRAIYPLSRGATVPASSTTWTRTGNAIELHAGNQSVNPEGVVVQGVLIPTPTATTAPDVLYDEWAEAMEHGINANAMLRPGGAWYQPQLAQYHERLWSQYRAKARSYGRAGGATARRRVVDPWARST